MNSWYTYLFGYPKIPIEVSTARKLYERNVQTLELQAERETSRNLSNCYQQIQKMIACGGHNFTWCSCLSGVDVRKLEGLGYRVELESSYVGKDWDEQGHYVYLYDKSEKEE